MKTPNIPNKIINLVLALLLMMTMYSFETVFASDVTSKLEASWQFDEGSGSMA